LDQRIKYENIGMIWTIPTSGVKRINVARATDAKKVNPHHTGVLSQAKTKSRETE